MFEKNFKNVLVEKRKGSTRNLGRRNAYFIQWEFFFWIGLLVNMEFERQNMI